MATTPSKSGTAQDVPNTVKRLRMELDRELENICPATCSPRELHGETWQDGAGAKGACDGREGQLPLRDLTNTRKSSKRALALDPRPVQAACAEPQAEARDIAGPCERCKHLEQEHAAVLEERDALRRRVEVRERETALLMQQAEATEKEHRRLQERGERYKQERHKLQKLCWELQQAAREQAARASAIEAPKHAEESGARHAPSSSVGLLQNQAEDAGKGPIPAAQAQAEPQAPVPPARSDVALHETLQPRAKDEAGTTRSHATLPSAHWPPPAGSRVGIRDSRFDSVVQGLKRDVEVEAALAEQARNRMDSALISATDSVEALIGDLHVSLASQRTTKSEIASLTGKMSVCEQDKQELEACISTLKGSIDAQAEQASLQKVADVRSELGQRIDVLQREKRDLEQRVAMVEAARREAQQIIEQMKSTLAFHESVRERERASLCEAARDFRVSKSVITQQAELLARAEVSKEMQQLRKQVSELTKGDAQSLPEGASQRGDDQDQRSLIDAELVRTFERNKVLEEALVTSSRHVEEGEQLQLNVRGEMVAYKEANLRTLDQAKAHNDDLSRRLQETARALSVSTQTCVHLEAQLEAKSQEVLELQLQACQLQTSLESLAFAERRVGELEYELVNERARKEAAMNDAKDLKRELDSWAGKASEQSKMDGVATGFLQTKLRDMEDRLLSAHSQCGRLEAFEVECVELKSRLQDASDREQAMAADLKNVKRALKTARQQAAAAAADASHYLHELETKGSQGTAPAEGSPGASAFVHEMSSTLEELCSVAQKADCAVQSAVMSARHKLFEERENTKRLIAMHEMRDKDWRRLRCDLDVRYKCAMETLGSELSLKVREASQLRDFVNTSWDAIPEDLLQDLLQFADCKTEQAQRLSKALNDIPQLRHSSPSRPYRQAHSPAARALCDASPATPSSTECRSSPTRIRMRSGVSPQNFQFQSVIGGVVSLGLSPKRLSDSMHSPHLAHRPSVVGSPSCPPPPRSSPAVESADDEGSNLCGFSMCTP